ncbi:hypothetical protein E0K93_02450 [Puniceibacterium sp. HSS470]|uniref:hypothetical protein n=1 Tax=Pseudooceanicola sediminis TaxID=2211117 RepID=UPI0011C36C7C|nr:hypothetical protein [Pseudooceanicola sediminis]KAA2317184.1 hypothetical protein E0K93_02450 [Puniceibacterium sp. HSS470]
MKRIDRYIFVIVAALTVAMFAAAMSDAISRMGRSFPRASDAPSSPERYELIREVNNGWLLLDKEDGRICLVAAQGDFGSWCKAVK